MKICHVTMFAPSRCGLYEASRDMFLADRNYGHETHMIDVGIVRNGKLIQDPEIGKIDNRAGTEIISSDPIELNTADIIIMHTGINDNLIVKNQAPLLWVVHGRPLACFRPESNKQTQSYSLYEHVATWQRVKKMIYFWKEFESHWKLVFNNKDLVLDYPVIDQRRFSCKKTDFDFVNKGKYNFVVTDSNREDICNYEMIVSIINAANDEALKDVDFKIHFFGLDFPLENCWNLLLGKLKETGKLGDLNGRVLEIEKVYSKAHCLISPNSIIVRTIAEAVCCDCFVIANNCSIADININMNNHKDMVKAMQIIKNKIDNNVKTNQKYKKNLSFEEYNKVINTTYKEVIK